MSLTKKESLAYIKIEDGRYFLYYHKICQAKDRLYLGAVPAKLICHTYREAKMHLRNCLASYVDMDLHNVYHYF